MTHRKPGPARRGPLLPPSIRRWLYGIAAALLPLGTAYGLLDDTRAPLWLNLAGAVLLTVALANVDDQQGGGDTDDDR